MVKKVMKLKGLAVAVLVGLLCVGCGQDENSTGSAPKSKPVVQEQAQEQMFTQETMDKISKVAGPMMEKAEKAGSEVAAKAEEARQRTAEFATALKKESAPIMQKTGAALVVAGEKVQQAGKVLSAPETLVIANKNGKVTLPHREHGRSLGCAACHGDQQPGPMELDKIKAHTLCKGCHKSEGKGPTACSGCHEKKKAAAIEGC